MSILCMLKYLYVLPKNTNLDKSLAIAPWLQCIKEETDAGAQLLRYLITYQKVLEGYKEEFTSGV